MAQQFIKIFDDTVLKQSVNQGFEVQRTNTRLGKFTMGELAFTRDTGRLFVGNFTNLKEDKDSEFVSGGILTGNKYLGMIDSKPLTHWQNSNESITSVHLPLSYTEDSTIEITETTKDGNITKTFTEKALLKKDSKFRTDKNNGWSKTVGYNEVYDAYNGDYLYDVYNNAFIFFDKSIKPIEPTAAYGWDVDTNNRQHFKNTDGTFYSETDGNYSSYRTRFENVPEPQNTEQDTPILGNPKYPIYGDGYVVMRILEPDGISLGYKEREFDQSDGTATDSNYSHNYIELKDVPIDILYKSFDSDQFSKEGGEISFIGSGDKGLEISNIIGNSLTMPHEVTFHDINDASQIKILFKDDNISTKTEKILALTPDQNLPNLYRSKVLDPPQITITANTVTETLMLHPGQSYDLNFDKNTEDKDSNEFLYIFDPFRMSDDDGKQPNAGEFAYVGNFIHDINGNIVSCEEIPQLKKIIEETTAGEDNASQADPYSAFILYDSSGMGSTYTSQVIYVKKETDDNGNEIWVEYEEQVDGSEEEQRFSGNFIHPYLSMGLNYVKEPEPIAWGTGNYKVQFFIHPFICSPSTEYHSGNGGCIGSVGIASGSIWPSNYVLEDLTNFGIRIPDHARSVLCELHIDSSSTSQYSLVTASEYNAYPTSLANVSSIVNLSTISSTAIPSFTDSLSNIKVLFNKDSNTNCPNKFIVELPLYRNVDGYKFFSFAINASANWVIRAIGYRA